MTEARTPYEILQVSPEACREVIDAAYRALQKKHHPDAGGVGSVATALNQARSILLDPEARARYDAQLKGAGKPSEELSGHQVPGLHGKDQALERTYAICLRCKTRNLVDFQDYEQTPCFGCHIALGAENIAPSTEVQGEASPTPASPPKESVTGMVFSLGVAVALIVISFKIFAG